MLIPETILQDKFFLFQGGGERRSGGYGDRRQRGNKKFRRKIVREINLLAH